MFNQSGQRPPEINFKPLSDLINKFSGGNRKKFIILGGLIVLAIWWLASSFYSVGPSEQAALRLFGSYQTTTGPGLHWYWPSPIGQKNVESVTEIRRMELGFRSSESVQGTTDVPIEALMITGDENIVDVQMVVQYRIHTLKDYLFNVSDPGEQIRDVKEGRPDGRTLKDVSEASLRQVVGQRDIDDVLTTEKAMIEIETKQLIQRLLDDYGTGLEITQVKLQNVRPPMEVRDAFDDVVRAKEDRERTINLADAYKEDIIPKARGEAARITEAAEAYKAARIANAEGESLKFTSILTEYKNSQEVTRIRLYLEAMEKILPSVTKFLVDPNTGGNLLQMLNLQENHIAETVQIPQPVQAEAGTE